MEDINFFGTAVRKKGKSERSALGQNIGFGFSTNNQATFGQTKLLKKKSRKLTPAQKMFLWENNPKTCNICNKRVSKFSDAEFDHTRAYSKGGASNGSNVKIVHRLCNRLKGKKSLSETKKILGIKVKVKRRKKSVRKSSTKIKKEKTWFNPITGRNEPFRPFF